MDPPTLLCSRFEVSYLFQLLSDKGEYKEAMEVLKKALKLEPATKVRLCVRAGTKTLATFTPNLPVNPSHTEEKVILKLGYHHQHQSH